MYSLKKNIDDFSFKEDSYGNQFLSVFKRKGITMGKLLKETKEKFNISDKITFAGRLDPMAEGEVLILIGKNSCKNLGISIKYDKKYIFSFFTNCSSDSLDILGIPNISFKNKYINESDKDSFIKYFNKKNYNQNYPNYSSICVKNNDNLRKPLWWWTKNCRLSEIIIPSKNVSIKSLSFIRSYDIESKQLIDIIIKDLKCLEDDDNGFRKDEIIRCWEKLYNDSNLPKNFQVFDMTATVTSGTYIRQLIKDIGSYIGCDLLTLSIYRPFNGIIY